MSDDLRQRAEEISWKLFNDPKLHEIRTIEAALRAYGDEVREEDAHGCFDEGTLCGAPIHCGCREKIAAAIRARKSQP